MTGDRAELVDAATPDGVAEGSEVYALQLSTTGDGSVHKNHVPLDRIDSDIVVTKRADRVAAYVGDIVTYTVTVRNGSGSDLIYDAAADRGGIRIVDAIPSTFRYVDGSATATRRDLSNGQTQPISAWGTGELLLEFGSVHDGVIGPMDLPADTEIELRYFLVVGSSADPGQRYRNRVDVRAADTDTVISNVDYVDVRIEYDPVFDQGVLLGRVFCDADGDGRVDRGEAGLPSARVFLDSGYYADTDLDGRFHFGEIDPGLHLVKLDDRTLPPGSTIISDEARAFNVTRGLPAVIDFAVSCTENRVTDIDVSPGDGALAEAARLRRERYFEVTGTVAGASLSVDGVQVPLFDVALAAAAGNSIPTPPPARVAAPTEPPAQAAAGIQESSQGARRPAQRTGAEPAQPEAPAAAAGPFSAAPPAVASATPTASANPATTPSAPASAGIPGAATDDAAGPARTVPQRDVVTVRVDGGALVEPLALGLRTPAEATRWVVEIADVTSGIVAYQRSGTGAADGFVWDGLDQNGRLALASEAVYEIRLRALVGPSRYAAARPVTLVVQGTRERLLAHGLRHGELFERGRPNDELRAMLDEMRSDLARTAPARVRVEAHLDDRDEAEDEARVTQEQADAVVAYLTHELGVDPGRIEAFGRGTRVPLYPNIGDRTRNTNRRVEVKVIAPDPEILTPEIPAMPALSPGVMAGRRAVTVGPDGGFSELLPKPADGIVVLTLLDDDGAAHAATVAVREEATLTRATVTLPRVGVSIDIGERRARVGTADVELGGLDVAVEVENPRTTLNGRILEPALRFPFRDVPADTLGWTFEVTDQAGGLVWEESGEGPPPGGRTWQGRTSDGGGLTAGAYEARLTLRLANGGMASTAPRPFEIFDGEVPDDAPPVPTIEAPPTVVRVNGDRIDGVGDVFSTEILAASGRTVLIDVVTGGAHVVQPVTVPAGFDAQVSAPLDQAPFSIFATPIVPTSAPSTNAAVAPVGAATNADPDGVAPAPPADAERRRDRTPPTPETAPAPAAAPGASPFAPAGGGAAPVTASPAAPISDPAAAPSEGSADESPSTPAAPPAPPLPEPAPAPAPVPAAPVINSPFSPATSGRWLLTGATAPAFRQAAPTNPFSPFGPATPAPSAPSPTTAPAPTPASAAGVPVAPADAESAFSQPAEAATSPAPATAPTAATQPAPATPSAVATAAAAGASGYGDLLSFYAEQLDAALSTDDGADLLAALAASDAAQISVQLPPSGVPLDSNRLPVFGTTVPTNEVRVNGVAVDVDADGRFATVAELPGGPSTVVIETTDLDGNHGRLEWPVEVSNSSFFLMALADGAVGSRHADIAGATDQNSLTTDSGVTAYGQGRLYFQGWVSGESVLDNFFGDVNLTGHIDTGKERERESFIREVIQPDRSYPIFGDSSEPVSDVNSLGKVYVMVEAGDSSARWGNFDTSIEGVELLSYRRNLYGGQVVFDEVAADEFRTEVRAHVADEQAGTTQTYNYLRGTGGSIYYLQNRQLVEGSERVTVVVRDSVSGVELSRMPLTRNDDYTVRYSEGRIVLKSPLPSVADDGMLLGNYSTTRDQLRGHPVYLEVAYDYRGAANQSDLSYGAHARETMYDWVSIGGGVVEESRVTGPGYSLWGVEAGVGPTSTSRVDFEYAHSESNDLGYAYSDDGGLSFDRFRLDDGRDADGGALLVHGQFELADVLDTERDHIWNVDARYQRTDRGFFSNGRILDQGEERIGFASRLNLTERHGLQLRLDRIDATVDDLETLDLTDTARTRRQVTTAEYLYDYDPAEMRLSYQHTFVDDDRTADAYANDIVGIALRVRILRWLRLGVGQEVMLNGEDPNVIRGASGDTDTHFEDRFVTSVSTGIQITDEVELEATERFRYSGENAALVGLNVATDDSSRMYVQQRFDSPRDNSTPTTNTVVGGEQRFGDDQSGRTYGEYQTQRGISGDRSRAVLGFGKTWEIARGLSLDAGYEHSNTLTAESVESENSRDTVSVGFELARLDAIKLSSLFEARFDQGSLHSPAGGTCLAGSITSNPAFCRDELSAIGDRRQLVSMTTVEAQATRDVALFGRFDIVTTENTTLALLESRDVEGTAAVAYRPIDHNWLNLLFRYTYLAEMAPYQLELGQQRDERSHVLSFSPIVELPYNLQLVEKVAYRHIDLAVEGMPDVDNDLVLLINRLNYHVFRQWDVGAEYRFLRQSLTQDWRHGLLLEANYIIADHVRLGLGYNFSRFAEDELGDFDEDAHGVFFRVTAQY
ncbi:MAG: DUF11 domain-containing protein [Myxococcales bacterium]|nr:DUF11 domain-containing protein [Myxococcales bacterium]